MILTRGQFIVDHGTVLWATENIGFSGCVNFMSLGFAPRATSVSFELRNLSGLADVISVFTPNGTLTYNLPKNGSVGVSVQGSINSIGIGSLSNNYAFGVAGLVITQPPPTTIDYYLQFQLATDPAAPYIVEKQVTSGGTVNSQIALGTIFAIQLVKKTGPLGGIRTVTPIVSTYSSVKDTIDPPFETEHNLFSKGTAVSLSNGLAIGTESRVAAVHLGTWKLQMLPLSEEGLAPVNVTFNVVRPDALGGEHNNLDASIVDAAHERGVPPQILKGQIRQETGSFDPETFRYEPCSADFAYVSRGATKINTAAYQPFAMDDVLSNAEVTPAVDLRNHLYISDSSTPEGRRHIRHTDQGVTAKAIWIASDNWKGHGQRWSEQSCGALVHFLAGGRRTIDEFVTELDTFTAQTPTSSSYGLMQVMFDVAVKYKWSVPDPATPGRTTQNPRYLVDSDEALRLKHGGSMFAGSAEDVDRYQRAHGKSFEIFASQEDFYDSFKIPLWHYTGGGDSQKNYGVNIIDVYQFDYLPNQTVTVFP